MMNSLLRNTLLGTLLLLLGACGYHFPGQAKLALPEGVTRAEIQMAGEGVKAHPALTRRLKNRLDRRLEGTGDGAGKSAILRIDLKKMTRRVQIEDSEGRVSQYRLEAQARPVLLVDGEASELTFGEASGEATWFESRESSQNHAARLQAEREAMDQLADALMDTLSASF